MRTFSPPKTAAAIASFSVALLVILMLMVLPAGVGFAAQAQTTATRTPTATIVLATPDCDQSSALKLVQALGPSTPDAAKLVELGQAIDQFNEKCNGLSFTGKVNGEIAIIKFTAGKYMIAVKSKGQVGIVQRTLGGPSCNDSVGKSAAILDFDPSSGDFDSYFVLTVRQGCTLKYYALKVTGDYTFRVYPMLHNAKLQVLTPTPAPTKKGQ